MDSAATDKNRLRIVNRTSAQVLATHAGIANTSALRRQGLLKHSSLEPGDGLWIAPCEAVHSFGMKFEIDVLYLSKQKKVLKIRHRMAISRISLCLSAYSVLELPAGTAENTSTKVGDELDFERV